MAKKYEYVPRNEYLPVAQRISSCMDKVADILHEKGITFEWAFVGSANRYDGNPFITREIKGNKGFDFDVNMYLNSPDKDHIWTAKFARLAAYTAIDEVFTQLGYQHPEDRTSVLRVKFIDKHDKTIVHSCDFALFQKIPERDGVIREKFAKKYDKDGSYNWEIRGGKNDPANEKLYWMLDYIGDDGDDEHYEFFYEKGFCLLDDLKEEYLKLKNVNKDENKCSFQLFNEAVCNVYNKWMQLIKK